MNQKKYEDHEISNIIPLDDANIKRLEDSIKRYGLLQPIIIFENQILDGRCRYRACQIVGIEPQYVKWEGTYKEAVEYVISINIVRRHLTVDQRAGSAVISSHRKQCEDCEGDEKRNPNVSAECRKFGITKRQYNATNDVLRNHPDKFQELFTGNKNLKQIQKVLKADERQQIREKLLEQAESVQVPEDVEIYEGDCSELSQNLREGSVDCIITDPPYPRDNLDCWDQLGEIGKRVLKPGGFCLAYCGVMYLPDVMGRLNAHLDYHWMISLSLSGPGSKAYSRSAINGHRPILVYLKPPINESILKQKKTQFRDVIQGTGREKSMHEWQQAEEELRQLIETFTLPNDNILDPFAGSGTVLSMAHKLGRHGIGYEIDPEHVKTIRARLSGLGQL